MKNLFTYFIVVISFCLALAAEKDYTNFVLDLKNKIQQKPWKYSAYDRLAYITDTYGPRMWGSVSL
jgi:hypothetical protein